MEKADKRKIVLIGIWNGGNELCLCTVKPEFM